MALINRVNYQGSNCSILISFGISTKIAMPKKQKKNFEKFTCNAAVRIFSSISKIKGKEGKAVYFAENTAKNRFFAKKSEKLFWVESF